MLCNFWQKIIRKIKAKLGLSLSKVNYEKITPMSDSQLNFLLQVLQALSDSNDDAEAIYPLLQANLDKLDMDFAEALRSWATATLPNLEIEKAQSTVKNIFTFSNLIQAFPLGNRADNLEIAITGYDIILTLVTQ